MGHKKRKQDDDSEDDVDYSASELDAPAKKATKSKSTETKMKQPSKPKTAKKPKISEPDDESTPEEQPTTRVLTNPEGEKYVDLGNMRRATVRPFKGKTYLDIREFYSAGDAEKPGKKGISLTMEQWVALKRSANTIDSYFAGQGGKK